MKTKLIALLTMVVAMQSPLAARALVCVGAKVFAAEFGDKRTVGDVQKPLDPKLLATFADQLRSKDWQERFGAVSALGKLLAEKRAGESDFGPVIEPLFENAGWGGIASDNARTAEDALVRIGTQAKPL